MLMQRLEYAFPLETRSQLRHMDVDSRIRAMLSVFMPEEYEGQYQLTQTNRLSIELYMLSNGLGSYDSHYEYPIFGSFRAHKVRLLAMIRNFGWHKGDQFRSLLASREPTVEAIVEKIFASAVFQVDIEVVKLILDAGMDPNSLVKDSNGSLITPIQWTATVPGIRGAKMVELLISHKADIELRGSGRSALFRAISRANKEIIKALLRNNVVVNLRCLVEATRTVDTNLFEKLFTSCSGVNSLIYNTSIMEREWRPGNITLLGAAAKFGRPEIIKTIIRVCPSLANPRELEATGGADYFSPISVAIANSNTDALKALLDAGVDTNLVNGCEKPRIEQALAKGKMGAYEILAESGYTITQPMSYERFSVLMRLCITGEVNYTIEQLINQNTRLSHNFTEWSGEVLADAINHNDPLVIGLLLDFGAKVNANKVIGTWEEEAAQYLDTRGALQAILDVNGPKVLLKALELGKWDLAQWLVIREPVLLDESLYYNPTPLSTAAFSKQSDLVKFMLNHGARVTDRALFMATKRIKKDVYIDRVSSDEALEVLRILLSHFTGPAPTAIAEAGCGDTDFERTDEGMDQDIYLLELLLSEGVEPTGTPEVVAGENWHGLYEPQSALEVVVASGNRLALDILTRFPYNWGAESWGRALAVACSLPNEGLIDRILKRKPNMNEEVGFWRYLPNPPDWKRLVTFSTALQVALRLQNAAVIRKLLAFGDTDVNYPAKGRFGRTALQHAVENGNLELIMMLLSHDTDVNSAAAEEGGATALQLAAMNGYLGIARRLLDLGADVNAAGAAIEGRTALEGAAEHGRIDMVHMLLGEGALILGDAGEGQYENAVQRARGNGHYAVARMLERFRTKAEQAHVQFGISVDGGGEVYKREEGSTI